MGNSLKNWPGGAARKNPKASSAPERASASAASKPARNRLPFCFCHPQGPNKKKKRTCAVCYLKPGLEHADPGSGKNTALRDQVSMEK